MKHPPHFHTATAGLLFIVTSFSTIYAQNAKTSWDIDTAKQWQQTQLKQQGLNLKDGQILIQNSQKGSSGHFISQIKRFTQKTSLQTFTVKQDPSWHNWTKSPQQIGPINLQDAPVALVKGDNDYWLFGRYGQHRRQAKFVAQKVKLPGFDIPLWTTPFPQQFNAAAGRTKSLGGYHAWQSKDMKNWVHHGPVTERFSRWVTTAEYVDGKTYIYYDFPNDQDPHLYIDDDLTDGKPGENKGLVFKDPSHGSDCGVIRTLDGKFHLIYEDWTPVNPFKHSCDSPLGGRAVSPDGIQPFQIHKPAVDYRTKDTGKIGHYTHPHWHKEDPKNWKTGQGTYNIHTPEQAAFGDWAPISIGGQYYLFGDYHPVGKPIRTGCFTSSSLEKPFKLCGEIGRGHPDPDIMFAEGQFYLVTQTKHDYISPGPWVETVEARVGVDTNKDGKINHWSDWQTLKENYSRVPGFSKQIKVEPASLKLKGLPAGYGFQFELRLKDSTGNASSPVIDQVQLKFAP